MNRYLRLLLVNGFLLQTWLCAFSGMAKQPAGEQPPTNQIGSNTFHRFALKTFTAREGLPAKNTTAAIKDSRGFMWFGTENGLCKFDGYTFKTFVHVAGDSSSITSNYINTLVSDKKGQIWVGTMDGLNRFNPITETSVRFYHNPNKPTSLSNNKIWSLLCDKQGLLWVGTDYGFNRYNEKQNSFSVYQPNAKRQYAMKGKSVNAIIEDKENNLWLGNWSSGLNKFNKASERFSNYPQLQLPGRKNPNDVWSLALSNDGSIWVGCYWSGLFKFNPQTHTFKAFPSSDPANTAVFSLLPAGPNKLLVGGNHGFYSLNTQDNLNTQYPQNSQYTQNPHTPQYTQNVKWEKLGDIPGSPNGDIFYDPNGIVWVCTKGGLVKIDYNQYKFAFLALGLQQKDVRSMAVKGADLWMATNQGLFRYNLLTGKSKTFLHTADPSSLTSNDITKVYLDSKAQLWILTENGFDLFDEKQNRFIHHAHHSALGMLFNEDVFRDIVEADPDEYWLATDAGLKMYNNKTGQFLHYYNEENNPHSLNNNHLYSVIQDGEGNIWVGTYGGGLNRFDLKSKRFYTYTFNDRKKGSISNNIIQKVFIDAHHNIWVCTPDGLNKYIKKTNSFEVYSSNAGFAGNVFYDLLEDRAGMLWVLTGKGLSRFNPQSREVRNYDEGDGLFSNSTIAQATTGEIYLAGPGGIVYFNPADLKYNTEISPVYFTEFRIFNKVVAPGQNSALKQPLGLAREVQLRYDQNVFSFDFVALNYTHSEKNQYAYKLDGFDKKWNFIGPQHRASYTNLNPGTYTLRVKASNNDGLLNNAGRSITIIIRPPWYLSYWAYLLYAVACSGLGYLYIRYRNRQAQLKYEIRVAHIESEAEKELNEKKLAFFTNISHEFRSPLTLIINPVKELLVHSTNPEDQASLSIVHKNAARLLSLVDQLLLFRKAGSGSDQLKISRINVIALCKDVYSCFLNQTRTKNINYQFDCNAVELYIYADREKLEIALFNLLSNAIKFTPEGGEIGLSVESDGEQLKISVKDTGCGIAEQVGDKLYDRFYQEPGGAGSGTLNAGFGIGLYLVRSFIECQGGSISYSSQLGQGTTFFLSLPLKTGDLQNPLDLETERSGFLSELLDDAFLTESAKQEIQAPAASANSTLPADARSLLIIDDNAEIRAYIMQVFRSQYLLHEAANGEQGYEMIQQLLPDLVISDLMMPGMSGLDLCSLVKQDPTISYIPIILLTANASPEIMLKGLEGGADDYISKPFDKEVLRAKVENILKSKNNLQQYFLNHITLKTNSPRISQELRDFLDRCIELVEAHLTDREFNIQVLAAEIGMSSSGLFKKIKMISGQSPNSFIRFIRLRKAAQIFINTDNTVLETTYLVGINDPKYFREQFFKLFGMNPSTYIQKYRKPFSNTLHYNLSTGKVGK